jgi:hypothetical protein
MSIPDDIDNDDLEAEDIPSLDDIGDDDEPEDVDLLDWDED